MPHGWVVFKEGHGEGFQHYAIIFPERGLGVLLMSNSDNAESIFGHLNAAGAGYRVGYDDKTFRSKLA